MVIRKEFVAVGLAAVILIVLVLVLILATNERRTPPPAITGLIATDASYGNTGRIDLAWVPNDTSDFAYYSIYAAETELTDVAGLSPIGRINDRADVTYETSRYRIPGLQLALFAFLKDTEYWFAVTAVDLAGNESKVGTSVSATIEIMPPPPPIPAFYIVVTRRGIDNGIFGLEEIEDDLVGGDTGPFSPYTLTVPIGTTVAWANHDDVDITCYFVQRPHTVTSDTGLFHAELTEGSNMFSYTFTEAGVFGYHCDLHVWETGKVIVVAQALEEPKPEGSEG